VLAVDASHAAMAEATRRAARNPRKGGLPNALFVASALEALPPRLDGLASVVTVHFPWGSLLRAAVGQNAAGAARLAALVAPGGMLRLLVSAAPRDAAAGAATLDPAGLVATYLSLGMSVCTCRPATLDDVAAARSSWGRRLMASGGDRSAWLLELWRDEADAG
jgi:16S rRNA (adenine(1408)-N(1))-methyltransferase